jgi:hypothetical protein
MPARKSPRPIGPQRTRQVLAGAVEATVAAADTDPMPVWVRSALFAAILALAGCDAANLPAPQAGSMTIPGGTSDGGGSDGGGGNM